MKESKKVLFDVLAIKSVNHCDDEGKVAEYLRDYLMEAGIEAKVQRIDETHGNLIAFIPGESHDKHMVWNGHIDTVPYGDLKEWKTDPSVPIEIDGKVYARGTSDMKSGIAAMAYTLANIVKSGKKPAFDITLIGTCDEEKNGLGARELLNEGLFPKVDEVLIGEPTGLNIGIAQKGCMWLEINIFGKTSHGAYPEQGVSAIEYGVVIAEQMKKYITSAKHDVLGYATAHMTQISGGHAPNITPEHCSIMMDIRLVPGQSKEEVLVYLADLAEKYSNQTEGLLRVEWDVKNYRDAVGTPSDDLFTKNLQSCIEKHGVTPEHTGINYFTDGSMFLLANSNLKVLLFGAGEAAMCHKANEYVSLDKYEKSIEILTSFALGEVTK